MKKSNQFIICFLFFNFYACSLECKYLEFSEGITYINGIKYSGDCKSYHPNRKISSKRSYDKGLDDGSWEFFFPNGNIETLGSYSLGKRIGQWEYFYNNGSIRQISIYKNGMKDSTWVKYNRNGDPIWEKEFKNDTLISITNFSRVR